MSSLLSIFSTNGAIVSVFLIMAYCAYRSLTATRPHLPPGPKPAPVIGNMLQLSAEHTELLFQQWASQFGQLSRVSRFAVC